MINVI